MSKASHFAHAGGAHFAEGDFDGVGRGHCALNSPQGSIELLIFFSIKRPTEIRYKCEHTNKISS